MDAVDLERRVKGMHTQVALDPHGQFHFQMDRAMARRLGYTDAELDAAPAESIESFAGVVTTWRICAPTSGLLISGPLLRFRLTSSDV